MFSIQSKSYIELIKAWRVSQSNDAAYPRHQDGASKSRIKQPIKKMFMKGIYNKRNKINHQYFISLHVMYYTNNNGFILHPLYHNYDVASGSDITSCNKIDKPLVVYQFTETSCNDAFNVRHMAKP